MPFFVLLFLGMGLLVKVPSSDAFLPATSIPCVSNKKVTLVQLSESNMNGNDDGETKKYFDFLSRASGRARSLASSGWNQVAGKASTDAESVVRLAQGGSSQMINLAQWLDTQAKDGAAATNTKTRELILQFTGKSNYQFGDISKEVLRRATTASANVNIQDLILLFKVLLTVGAAITPLAKMLPIAVLLEALNVSLEARIGGVILETLAGALDERLLAAFSADELGDAVKRSLSVGIAAFTGKTSFEKGDIELAVKEEQEKTENEPPLSPPQQLKQQRQPKTIQLMVGPEFAEWDRAFLEETSPTDLDRVVYESMTTGGISSQELDREFLNELEEWDRKFQSSLNQ